MIGMWLFAIVLTAAPAVLLIAVFWNRIVPPLVGGYYRRTPAVGGAMYFLTRRAAERYGTAGLSAIDPYARRMGPVEPAYGRLLRRKETTR